MPSELASSHPSLAALKGCQEVLHLLVLWSLLSASREAAPTHRAGPSFQLSPPSTSYLPLASPPTVFLPWFTAFHCPEFQAPSHPRQSLGQGGETLSLRSVFWATTVMRRDGRGYVSWPGMSTLLGMA